MIGAIKEFLHLLLAPSMFAAMLAVALAAATKRAQWGVYLIAVFASLPTLWYPLQQFPFGKDSIDVLIFATIVGIFVNKGGFERTPGTAINAIFLVVSYLALWNSSLRFDLPWPITTSNPVLGDWKNYAQMIFLFWLCYSAVRTEKEQKILIVIIASVVLLISFREFRNFTAGSDFDYDKRAQGPFWIVGLGANHLGAFIAHYAGFLFGMSLVDTQPGRRWLYRLGCLFSLHPLFFAYSRGAYLAAMVVITVYAVLKKRSLILVIILIATSWEAILPDSVVSRITMTETPEGQLEDSAAERVLLWEHAKSIFNDNPVFGVGFNGFELTRRGEMLRDTHNFYMKTACEQGVIGLVLLALLMLRALLSGWKLYRVAKSEFHRAMGLGFVGCVLAVLATNIFGDRFSYFSLGAFFWLIYGMVERAITLSTQVATGKAEPTCLDDAAAMPATSSAPASAPLRRFR